MENGTRVICIKQEIFNAKVGTLGTVVGMIDNSAVKVKWDGVIYDTHHYHGTMIKSLEVISRESPKSHISNFI